MSELSKKDRIIFGIIVTPLAIIAGIGLILCSPFMLILYLIDDKKDWRKEYELSQGPHFRENF